MNMTVSGQERNTERQPRIGSRKCRRQPWALTAAADVTWLIRLLIVSDVVKRPDSLLPSSHQPCPQQPTHPLTTLKLNLKHNIHDVLSCSHSRSSFCPRPFVRCPSRRVRHPHPPRAAISLQCTSLPIYHIHISSQTPCLMFTMAHIYDTGSRTPHL